MILGFQKLRNIHRQMETSMKIGWIPWKSTMILTFTTIFATPTTTTITTTIVNTVENNRIRGEIAHSKTQRSHN